LDRFPEDRPNFFLEKQAYFFKEAAIHVKRWDCEASLFFPPPYTDRSEQMEQRSFSDKTKEGSSRGPHEVDPASGSTKATASLLQAINCF
jgi:hypothetical protein